MTIDQVLDRLLHRRSALQLFLEDPKQLDLPPDDLDALLVIDRDELIATATAVRHDVMRRNHRGSGALVDLYPRTIAERDVEELTAEFMESEPFEAYRELPFAGVGLSLEESFYRYCEAQAIGDPKTREHEFLSAMMKALLFSPRPNFEIPERIRPCARGVFATAGTMLYATVDQKLVIGELTPFLIDLIVASEDRASIAARHGISQAELHAAVDELCGLGLLGR